MIQPSRFTRRFVLSAFALLALVGVSGVSNAAHAVPTVTIAQARALPLGTLVTIEGSITTPSGAFESSFFDKGFALQDRTAGIFVSLQTNLGVAPRRRARVTGTLADSFGLRLIVPASPSDVRLLGVGPAIAPRWFHTAAISEATEGLLVRVVGHVSSVAVDDLPFGYIFKVDDGSGEVQIFVNTQTGIDPFQYSLGQLVSVVGFSSQFADHYEIDPRSPADIRTP